MFHVRRLNFDNLALPVKAIFHDDHTRIVPYAKRFFTETDKEDIPSCPCCNARMDMYGHWYASRIVVNGMIYYCNNPICNGGRHGPSLKQDPTEQESSSQ